jgi:probable H4MPT-linked C1 transfer pathway protein
MPTAVIGLDVGGANLKAAHSEGRVLCRAFELWRNPGLLADALADLLRQLPHADLLAVTTTGELCDCYETKRQGVTAILDAVELAAAGIPIRVWTTTGHWADSSSARRDPVRIAAANWLALATYVGRWLFPGAALVLDIGSTTTDIIPVSNGKPTPNGRTDPERLRCRELVYTGCRRTPVCALLGGDGAAELFAQTLDVYLVLGLIPEDTANRGTADGRPATKTAAHARLARMLCADSESCGEVETTSLARMLASRQAGLIRDAINQVVRAAGVGPFPRVVLGGSGEFLGRLALELTPAFPAEQVIALSARVGSAASGAACAFALCRLAQELDWDG